MADPVILAFDTSGAFCAAALMVGDQVTSRTEDMSRGQGERLMGLLEDTLENAGLTWADLDAIGVGTGPGNFTGIRISVSAARGLALGLGIPAVGVNGFNSAAFGMNNVIACLPAPRNQAYVQARVAGADQNPTLVDLSTAFKIPFLQRPEQKLPDVPARAEPQFCGPAAREVAATYYGRTLSEDDIRDQPVSAIEAIARLAARRMHTTQVRPTPLYVRPADAAPPREKPPVILP